MITKSQLLSWRETTWATMLEQSRNLGDTNQDRLNFLLANDRTYNDYKEFSKTLVDGFISEGWKDHDYSYLPRFQDSYAHIISLYPSDWTPTEYVIAYYRTCLSRGIVEKQDLGRAIRNLPSFFREDLLYDAFLKRGLNVSIPTVEQNVKEHADIFLEMDGRKITIWSYLDSGKAKDNLAKKLFKRGRITEGLNLLASIGRNDYTDYYGWKIISDAHIDKIISVCKGPYTSWESFKDEYDYWGTIMNFKFFMYP